MSNITYTWKVTGLKTRQESGLDNVIFQTYWEKTGKDESGASGTFAGATPIQFNSSDSFVPFDQITESTVLGWIQAVVVGEYEKHVNEQIQKKIDAESKIAVDAALPWIQQPPTPTEPAAPVVDNQPETVASE